MMHSSLCTVITEQGLTLMNTEGQHKGRTEHNEGQARIIWDNHRELQKDDLWRRQTSRENDKGRQTALAPDTWLQ